MKSCSEFVLSDVIAITAVSVSDYTSTDNILSTVIPSSEFNPELDNAIVVGINAPYGQLIPIMKGSGKVKDSESDNVAGRLHTVSVECEADDRDTDIWEIIRKLERTPSHLILTLHDNSQVFVRATEDTYQCTVERGSGKTSISIRIQNLMGLQPIV